MAIKDYPIEGTNHQFKAGQIVVIPAYALQRDPEYYPNPDAFDPDRFSPAESASRNPYTFLPFGEGPRNCIGSRFGMMQARIGIITLLSNFKLTLSPKTPCPLEISKTDFILSSVGGVWLKIGKVE